MTLQSFVTRSTAGVGRELDAISVPLGCITIAPQGPFLGSDLLQSTTGSHRRASVVWFVGQGPGGVKAGACRLYGKVRSLE